MNRKYIYYSREFFGLVSLLFKLFIPSRKLQILSIYFHNPSPYLFGSIIKHLNDCGYKFISLKQFNEIIENRQLNEKVAIITIDDGWQNNLKLLDIVRKYKVFITIFITTTSVEEGNFWWEYVIKRENINKPIIKQELESIKKLNEKSFYAEIRKLKSSLNLERSALTKEEVIQLSKEPFVAIGSHSVSHPILTNISYKVQKSELSDSKIVLESWTNNSVIFFSYPNGNYSEELKTLAKECGYELCFIDDASYIDLDKVDKFSIPRMSIYDNGGYFEALSKIYGIWQRFHKE